MTLSTLNTFQTVISTLDGIRPATSVGPQVTPGASNTYGSYTSVLAGSSLTHDCYLLEVNIANVGAVSGARGCLVTIGIDTSGGTTYTALISDLLISGAPGNWYQNGVPMGGHNFVFPIFIPANSRIGAKAQSTDAAPTNIQVNLVAHCNPTHPHLVRCGTFVRTFGVNTVATNGVTVTPGGASEGSWTEIGTAADDLFWLEIGIGKKGATLNNFLLHVDTAVGTAISKRVAVLDRYCLEDVSERVFKMGAWGKGVDLVVGEKIYARLQGSTGTPDDMEVTAYGVGGRYTPSAPYSVAGSVSIAGSPAPDGKTVNIFAVDSDGVAELVTSTTTSGGTGSFNASVYDNTREHFASYEDVPTAKAGRSLSGIPSADAFSIIIGGGSSDVVDPVVIVVSTPTTPDEPLIVQLYDTSAFSLFQLTCKDRPDGKRLVVYSPLDSGFVHPFNGKSTFSGAGINANPYVFTIYRRGGWPTGLSLDVRAQAVDSAGNEVNS
jgi:hypothetical protein